MAPSGNKELHNQFQSETFLIKVRDTIPGARLAVIEGPGHEIYVDEPEECLNALLKFLRSLG